MKKLIAPIVPVAFLLAVIQGGCYYDNNAELHPEILLNNGGCDTSAVSFATDVLPILNQSCGTKNTCHGSSNTSGIPMTNYAEIKVQADNGKLVSSVTWDGNASQMPKNSNQLNTCYITLISKWVAEGAQDN